MPISSHSFSLQPIGIIHTPFKEKFGIPRQPGLVAVPGRIEMLPPWNRCLAFEGLLDYSHIWLTFVFHQSIDAGWRDRVRPPRLGGNARRGVFATRSPFRPNHLGLSVVRLIDVRCQPHSVVIEVEGVDMLDQTPIVDIRPYVPYADSISEASSGFASAAPIPELEVVFSAKARADIIEQRINQNIVALIEQLLALDPRPAYRRRSDEDRDYGMRFYDWNIRWRVTGLMIEVLNVQAVE